MDAEFRIGILRRDGWSCQRPDCLTAGRGGRKLEIHHRYRPGRIDTPANCITLCSACHADVHNHPERSYEDGLLIRSSGELPTVAWLPPDPDVGRSLPKFSSLDPFK